MSQNRSFFGTIALIGLGAAALAGTVAAYKYRKEIREKANEWATITISRIKNEDGPDYFSADMDHDGVDDTIMADLDGDGDIDAAAVDTDGDGEADVILTDTDGDGVLDTAIDPDDLEEEHDD